MKRGRVEENRIVIADDHPSSRALRACSRGLPPRSGRRGCRRAAGTRALRREKPTPPSRRRHATGWRFEVLERLPASPATRALLFTGYLDGSTRRRRWPRREGFLGRMPRRGDHPSGARRGRREVWATRGGTRHLLGTVKSTGDGRSSARSPREREILGMLGVAGARSRSPRGRSWRRRRCPFTSPVYRETRGPQPHPGRAARASTPTSSRRPPRGGRVHVTPKSNPSNAASLRSPGSRGRRTARSWRPAAADAIELLSLWRARSQPPGRVPVALFSRERGLDLVARGRAGGRCHQRGDSRAPRRRRSRSCRCGPAPRRPVLASFAARGTWAAFSRSGAAAAASGDGRNDAETIARAIARR